MIQPGLYPRYNLEIGCFLETGRVLISTGSDVEVIFLPYSIIYENFNKMVKKNY